MTPLNLARETLLRLAALRLPPTPENYVQTYQAIAAAKHATTPAHHAEQDLWESIINHLPAAARLDKTVLQELQQLLAEHDLPGLIRRVVTLSHSHQSSPSLKTVALDWASLIQKLIHAWDEHIPGLTTPKKRQALDRLLETPLPNDDDTHSALYFKLERLLESWQQPLVRHDSSVDLNEAVDEGIAEQTPATLPDRTHPENLPVGWETWCRITGECLERGVAPRYQGFPELEQELAQAGQMLLSVNTLDEQELLSRHLKKLWIRTELHMQHESRLVNGLTNLLSLLLSNLNELAGSDRYLTGQIEMVRELLTTNPITMRNVYEVETGLKEVIYKQGLLKHSLDQATDSMREMLNTFTDRLSMMVDNTDDYHSRIQGYNQQLQDAKDPITLGQIVEFLMNDTRSIQVDLVSTRDQLVSTREQVTSAEQRIEELETALNAASAKIREDQLTGAYNRLGLEEIFQREHIRSTQTERPLALALIDIDNFKQLNDRYGHLAGDDALKHLVSTAREKLRPTDYVARFGGEEFIVLMPETDEHAGHGVITQLQRELTRAYFMANNSRLVLTFSAGVTKCQPTETLEDIIDRADRAMYAAKLAGKNRALIAPEDL